MGKAKLIVFGLDGGTFRIIDPLIKEGKLPNLKKLIDNGTRATLKSTIPPLTAPAWISFMTGMNPGRHGFYDFIKVDNIDYDSLIRQRNRDAYKLVHSGYFAGKTIWDILSKYGYNVSSIMMPMTYPAWKINGTMIAGFPSPDFMKPDTYPKEFSKEIGSLCDMSINVSNREKFINECKKLVRKEREIILSQLKSDKFDAYGIVFSSTDFAGHYLWKYISDKTSPYSSAINEIYIEIDNLLGEVMAFNEKNNCSYVVMSDHGMTASPKKRFNTNSWLIKENYLFVKEKKPGRKFFNVLLNFLRYRMVKVKQQVIKYFHYLPNELKKKFTNIYYENERFEWDKTKAFRYRIGQIEGIVINLKGRQSGGIVLESEYESFRKEIIEKIKKIIDPETGEKVASNVYAKEEIFTGPYLNVAPDIIIILEQNYMGGIKVEAPVVEHVEESYLSLLNGVHDFDGISILNGPMFKKGLNLDPINIIDLLPTILISLNLPLPDYLDGRIVKEAFCEDFIYEVKSIDKDDAIQEKSSLDLSDNDESKMKNALKGLGYM